MALKPEVLQKLEAVSDRYEELNNLMAQSAIAADPHRLQELAKEQSNMAELVTVHRAYAATLKQASEARLLLDESADDEFRDMAKEELEELTRRQDLQEEGLKRLLLPRDPNDEKDVIVEVRAGTGGDEAGLFAADLFRMYTRYAEAKRWQVEVISSSESGIGGFKEIIFEVDGRGAYSRLKYESGVHRVQRVPLTEASGRIHTSTATVAVLPVADELEVAVSPDEIRVDIFHAGGAGGQNVNKVATAVRLTHIPTGLVVVCQDERSQLKNRTKAMSVLRARLKAAQQEQQDREISETRRAQVGTAERSEKSRTYNFPQNRITDHRIDQSFHNLPEILDGAIDSLIDAVATHEEARSLEAQLV
ncbi:MAG: peptide chain release factor 1 [Dehalococcoidia bacterium]|nr:peptide chain release factor 1 [Dehalococcoidia bacterium]